jgi:predicted RNA-binding Zn-ribbon protein involved in translation (DUF1610 family)
MYIIKCDKCGKLSAPKENTWTNDGWESIGYNITGRNTVYKHLCPNCKELLKIPEANASKYVGDNLIEILSEIAREAVCE